MHLPITLHWLAGYSLIRLIAVAGGILVCAVMGIVLLVGQEGKNKLPVPVVFLYMLFGACTTISSLLIGKPRSRYELLGVILEIIGGVSGLIGAVLTMRHQKTKHAALPQPEPAAPSDKGWPPPPTSQGRS